MSDLYKELQRRGRGVPSGLNDRQQKLCTFARHRILAHATNEKVNIHMPPKHYHKYDRFAVKQQLEKEGMLCRRTKRGIVVDLECMFGVYTGVPASDHLAVGPSTADADADTPTHPNTASSGRSGPSVITRSDPSSPLFLRAVPEDTDLEGGSGDHSTKPGDETGDTIISGPYVAISGTAAKQWLAKQSKDPQHHCTQSGYTLRIEDGVYVIYENMFAAQEHHAFDIETIQLVDGMIRFDEYELACFLRN